MSEVTKPMALDETLQQVVTKLSGISSVAGKSAYQSAQDGGFTGTEAEFNAEICKMPIIVRQNLLDNWYFVGGGSQQGGGKFPINQKGQTSWSSAGYTFDRWTLTSGSMSLASGGILLNGTMQLVLEKALGDTVTASALLSDNSMITPTYNDSTKIFTLTAANKTIVAVKLERGNTQTLAHQEYFAAANTVIYDDAALSSVSSASPLAYKTFAAPVSSGVYSVNVSGTTYYCAAADVTTEWVLNEIPNYTEELWKCQRYYQIFASSSYRPTYGEDCRPPMRAHTTTKGTISIGGTTYYYADANL